MSALLWLGVGVLGGVAAVVRFVLDELISRRTSASFPAGTFVVNLTGALLVGLTAALSSSSTAVLLIDTAALGSYTTFSTWMLETHRLGEDGEIVSLGTNLVLSLVLGLGAVALGDLIGRAL